MRRRETQQRKQALVGLKRTAGMDWMLGTLVCKLPRQGDTFKGELLASDVGTANGKAT